jgi:hypothetical protein
MRWRGYELETGTEIIRRVPITSLMNDTHLDMCLRELENAIKDGRLTADSYVWAWIFAELNYPTGVLESVIKMELVEQSTFYQEVLEEGIISGRAESIFTILTELFGPVSDQLSRKLRIIRVRNSALLDDLIKLAATAKDIGGFERVLGEMSG